uniref:Uncharacterized protein n=1 Tax=Vespula pensylvanica TaxID=30213 RepID=A0A834KW36_VESPE|nr:hypothetical protein H0235_012918 [Vespula pensylvanica]
MKTIEISMQIRQDIVYITLKFPSKNISNIFDNSKFCRLPKSNGLAARRQVVSLRIVDQPVDPHSLAVRPTNFLFAKVEGKQCACLLRPQVAACVKGVLLQKFNDYEPI